MPQYTLKIRTCIFAFMAAIALTTTSSLRADIVTVDFNFEITDVAIASGTFPVTSVTFDIPTAADIAGVSFEANFAIVDAGVDIVVNNQLLFSTGDDVSNFSPTDVFSIPGNPTPPPDDRNIFFPFSPSNNDLPRLSSLSDSTGTSFSGAPRPDSTGIVDYTPLFSIANFSDLLETGENTIEILNRNDNGQARLIGDFTLVAPETTAVPEPSAGSLCLIGGLLWMKRRRRRQ